MKLISYDKIHKLNKTIGIGGFGKVFAAELTEDGPDNPADNQANDNKKDELYAVKVIRDHEFRFIIREGCLLNFVNHPYIIDLKACNFFNESGDFEVSFITPLAKNETLHNFIQRKIMKKISPIDKNKIIYGICRGVWYLHHNQIYHRDIKSLNILMMDEISPKISDLGTSKIKEDDIKESVAVSSPYFEAPEVHDYKGSFPSDVFSLSLVLWEIFEGNLLHNYFKKKLVIYKYIENRPTFSEKTPQIWRNLIEKMWQVEKDERPTMNEIIADIEKPDYFLPNVDEDEMNKFIANIKKIEADTYYYVPNNKAKYVHDINSKLSQEINNNNDDKIDENQYVCLSRSIVDYLINDFEENIDDEEQQNNYDEYYNSYLKFIYSLFNLININDSEAMFASAMFCMENICDYSIAYEIIQKLEKANQRKAQLLHFLIEKQSEKSLFIKAMLLEAQGEFQKAVDTYYECIEQGKIDEKVLGRLGRLLAVFGEKEEEKEEGMKLMENAASLNDQFSLYQLGVIYLKMAEKEKDEKKAKDYKSTAVKYLERADQFPDSYLQLYNYSKKDTEYINDKYSSIDLIFDNMNYF